MKRITYIIIALILLIPLTTINLLAGNIDKVKIGQKMFESNIKNEEVEINNNEDDSFKKLDKIIGDCEITDEEMSKIVGERITDGISPDSHNDKYSGNDLYINKVTHYYLYLKRRYNTLFMKYLFYLEGKHVSKKIIDEVKKRLKELGGALEEAWEQIQLLREASRLAKEKMMEDPY